MPHNNKSDKRLESYPKSTILIVIPNQDKNSDKLIMPIKRFMMPIKNIFMIELVNKKWMILTCIIKWMLIRWKVHNLKLKYFWNLKIFILVSNLMLWSKNKSHVHIVMVQGLKIPTILSLVNNVVEKVEHKKEST